MASQAEFDRLLRSALREALERETGPDPRWTDSPAAQRIERGERAERGERPLRLLAVAALVATLATGAALLLAGQTQEPPPAPAVANGWIAYTVRQPLPAGGEDLDIWFSHVDREPRRAVGAPADTISQLCPAFSADGRRLAYARTAVEGSSQLDDGSGNVAAYRDVALVIADVRPDGTVVDRQTIELGDGVPPPCPVWAPGSERIAFGLPRTSPINPETSPAGSEVQVVRLADGDITVLPDLLATDLDWSPDGRFLAISGGRLAFDPGQSLPIDRLHLYAIDTGALETIAATDGPRGSLSWAPDGRALAYTSLEGLRVLNTESGEQAQLTGPYRSMHGIGPIWSPDGDRIAYQRSTFGEHHEVVVLEPGDPFDDDPPGERVHGAFHVRGESGRPGLEPFRVTWSPDSSYLLSVTWTGSLVAVPVKGDGPPIVLARDDGIVPYEGYPNTTMVPIQTWARELAE